MDIVKLNWSAGKDSTASYILHGYRGDIIKAVIYIPFLTDEIPLILKRQYDFIIEAEEKLLCRYPNSSINIVHGITYWDHVHRIVTKGPRKGKIYGIGLGFGFCQFRNYSKIKALVNAKVGKFDYEDIGIAFDEYGRHSQLNYFKRSILVENRIIEKECFNICKKHGLLSPVYETRLRDGCAICPNAKREELKYWLQDWPDAREILIAIEHDTIEAGQFRNIYINGEKWSDRF